MSSFEVSYDEYNMDVLVSIAQVQQYCDLNLWKIQKEINHSFLLLKGEFLLVFSIQMEGTPLMTFITHKGYLTAFFNSLMKIVKRRAKRERTQSAKVPYFQAF